VLCAFNSLGYMLNSRETRVVGGEVKCVYTVTV
jgi:hypothetical protein